ncbi:hypothetical protein [Micromonospora sp. AKA38]|uniref:hypothetical protein n=1 Tax=Micromonospora sp. AKA38 TaxID=2733861 RepID=UPI0024924416|nr:hypothetical protein [Micromonospora sp. AKA38]
MRQVVVDGLTLLGPQLDPPLGDPAQYLAAGVGQRLREIGRDDEWLPHSSSAGQSDL